MHDEWFADEERVRKAVGLLEKRAVQFPDGEEVSSQHRILICVFKYLVLNLWLVITC